MKRLRPRPLLWLLSFSCILWMALAPLGARASANWDGPMSARLGGPPNILAGAVSAPTSQGSTIAPVSQRIAVPKIAPHAKPATTTAAGSPSAAAHRKSAGGAAKSARSGLSAAPPSPALNLPAYSSVGTGGGQPLDGGSIAGLAIKFLVVLVLLFIVLRVLKAIMPRSRGDRGGRKKALLLHSESIGEKQRILLLDLGGKLLAVGVSGTGMTTLATIEERDAVDTIRARYVPLSDAVPGYSEGITPAPLSRSFVETLKRAGLTMQHQAAETPVAPLDASMAGGGRVKAGNRDAARPPRAPVGGARQPAAPAGEPILHEALEAMRAVRRRVEGA